ncbi:MAG TPA: MBL fold metallo-hydrolase [Chloroflexota bacterium]|nr:MBL fold metallo-hydrolase [Chloroflexota bacterium]
MEIATEGGRLLLDLGMPLPDRNGSSTMRQQNWVQDDGSEEMALLPPIAGLRGESSEKIAALVISHAHQDHYGLALFVPPDTPIYATTGTRALMKASRIFLPHAAATPDPTGLPKSTPVQIGPFKVTATLVDHSAPDAAMLLVEAERKRILYSGDLRAHGRKARLFDRLIEKPPADIDYLLLEGTTLGRGSQEMPNETAVEQALVERLANRKNLVLLFCSSQNLDRLVSVYRAAKRTDSTLVIDLYTAYLLKSLTCISARLPQHNWPGIRVKYWKHHADCLVRAGEERFLYEVVGSRIQLDEIVDKREKVLVLARSSSLLTHILRRLPTLDGLQLIWSMWSGYLTGEDPASQLSRDTGIALQQIHTSGHAGVEDLRRLATAIHPRRLIPIHTSAPEQFSALFDNVLPLQDGQWIDCDLA